MKRIFLGWKEQPFPHYIAAFHALGASIERDTAQGCDALVLPGGSDLHPRLYGQRVDGAVGIDTERDRYELTLFYAFASAGKPVFGICRGMQLINVALGGALYQHISGHSQINGGDSFHTVRTDDPLLRKLYGGRFTVNSAHHQAVRRLGAGLRAAARADDGTIEALRHKTLPIFAVQWHPERLGAEGEKLLAHFLKNA